MPVTMHRMPSHAPFQHQFDETHWSNIAEWQFPEAALQGASHYNLPPVPRWITGNIGVHHVHHLSSRIPYYRLPEVLRDHPELAGIGRITLWQSLQCVWLVLRDERRCKLVSFRDAAKRGQPVGLRPLNPKHNLN